MKSKVATKTKRAGAQASAKPEAKKYPCLGGGINRKDSKTLPYCLPWPPYW